MIENVCWVFNLYYEFFSNLMGDGSLYVLKPFHSFDLGCQLCLWPRHERSNNPTCQHMSLGTDVAGETPPTIKSTLD